MPTILYVGGFELPDKNAAAHRVINNGKLFRELGYKVYYYGATRETNRDDMSFQGFPCGFYNYPQNAFQWVKFLLSIKDINHHIKSQLKQFPDIIIAYNYPGVALYLLKRYCRKTNIQLISDCTEWYVPEGNAVFRLIKGFDVFVRMRLVQPYLDGIICVSEYLYCYYKDKTKCVKLPPLVDKTDKKWISENVGTEEDGIVLTYAGSPGSNKDKLNFVIDILSKIQMNDGNNLIFNVVGISKQQYFDIFQISQLPEYIADKIVFYGKLSHQEAIDIIKKSSYTIFLRENNLVSEAGFPTKFVESITCGTPVITNLTSNIRDYLHDGLNGFILDICKLESCSGVLEQAINQPIEMIQQMKDYCRSSNSFDYRKYIDDLEIFLKTQQTPAKAGRVSLAN